MQSGCVVVQTAVVQSAFSETTASNLEQVANLHGVIKPTVCSGQFLPELDEKLVAYMDNWTWHGLWGESLVWMIGVVVCLLVAPRVQLSISVGNGWLHNVL